MLGTRWRINFHYDRSSLGQCPCFGGGQRTSITNFQPFYDWKWAKKSSCNVWTVFLEHWSVGEYCGHESRQKTIQTRLIPTSYYLVAAHSLRACGINVGSSWPCATIRLLTVHVSLVLIEFSRYASLIIINDPTNRRPKNDANVVCAMWNMLRIFAANLLIHRWIKYYKKKESENFCTREFLTRKGRIHGKAVICTRHAPAFCVWCVQSAVTW